VTSQADEARIPARVTIRTQPRLLPVLSAAPPADQAGGRHDARVYPERSHGQTEHRTPIPKAPFWLGAGGLIPFVVITSAMWALPPLHAAAAVLAERLCRRNAELRGRPALGAVDAAPGHDEQDQSVFMAWSVVPALVGWISLLMPRRPV